MCRDLWRAQIVPCHADVDKVTFRSGFLGTFGEHADAGAERQKGVLCRLDSSDVQEQSFVRDSKPRGLSLYSAADGP